MKQALRVKRSQIVPLGAARWLSVEVKTESRPKDQRAKELLQREPQPRTHGLYPSPSPRLSPRPRERGVCRLFQGAGLMGKSWQDDQGKLTPSTSCFMKAWRMCREQRKEAAEEGKIEIYSKRRMKSVPSSEVSARAFLFPFPSWPLSGHRV